MIRDKLQKAAFCREVETWIQKQVAHYKHLRGGKWHSELCYDWPISLQVSSSLTLFRRGTDFTDTTRCRADKLDPSAAGKILRRELRERAKLEFARHNSDEKMKVKLWKLVICHPGHCTITAESLINFVTSFCCKGSSITRVARDNWIDRRKGM